MDYEEVFHKDTRNTRGAKDCKKRTNVKEVAKRYAQMEKRGKQG